MFGNWVTVFLILKYGTLYFYSVTPFAYSFCSQSTIPKIDEFVVSMTDIDPVHRLDAKEAKERHGTMIFYSMAPESLLINLKSETDRHDVRVYM